MRSFCFNTLQAAMSTRICPVGCILPSSAMGKQFLPVLQSLCLSFLGIAMQAVANIFSALLTGVSVVDSSVAGLGGCPFSPGASGSFFLNSIPSRPSESKQIRPELCAPILNSVFILIHFLRKTYDRVQSPPWCELYLSRLRHCTSDAGNVATEDVVFLLDGLGIKHGIDTQKLSEASRYILGELGKETNSRSGKAIEAQRERLALQNAEL